MKNNSGSKKINTVIKYTLLLLFTASIFQTSTYAQERKLIYDVMRNGNIIGKIDIVELTKDQKKFLSLTSDVNTRFILSFSIHTAETAAYQDDVMVYSSFYEKKTGSYKASKTTIASGECYKLMDCGVLKLISCSPIRYNMLLLYTNIPETINKVYSDNFQTHLDIKKVEENKYRLSLPDGNHNYYTYKNGVCSKVDIERTFFTIQFVLREKLQ
jgi:hypothetical protein